MKNLKLLLFFTLLSISGVQAQVIEQDSLALVSFYNSTGGPNWDDNSGWLTESVNQWFGITVTGNRVTEISLNNNNLNGIIPLNIGSLSELKGLFLGNDPQLTGEIPTDLFSIITIERLGIGNCSIHGTIPNTIGNCVNLIQLNLVENNLTGSIPSQISNLTNLVFLDLYGNQLSGSIPTGLGDLAQLRHINLKDNQLSGELPTDLGNMQEVEWFDVSNNQLTGAIPQEYANNWPMLVGYFYISNNQFTDLPDFSGHIFDSVGIHHNLLTFEDIEINMDITDPYWFLYTPQANVGEEYETTLIEEDELILVTEVGGVNNLYQWKKDSEVITDATQATLNLSPLSIDDAGVYTCEVTNTEVPDLIIYRRPITVNVNPLGIDDIEIPQFLISPNPSTGVFYITSTLQIANDKHQIMLTNALGQQIYKSQISGLKSEISLTNLSIGIYLLSITHNDYRITKKIIIIH